MTAESFNDAMTVLMLAGTPMRIAGSIANVEPARLHTVPTQGGWTANDLLAHLRSCADMWGGAIERILGEDHPTFRAVNPTTYIKQTDYPEQPFLASLAAFVVQRRALVATLEALPPDAWDRAATVSIAGKPRERTLRFYAEWLAKHERSHYKQFDRIIAGT